MTKSTSKIHSMQHILDAAKGYPILPVAVVDAGETHLLNGIMQAQQAGLVEPVLIGQEERNILLHALCWVHTERLVHKVVALNKIHRQDIARVRGKSGIM